MAGIAIGALLAERQASRGMAVAEVAGAGKVEAGKMFTNDIGVGRYPFSKQLDSLDARQRLAGIRMLAANHINIAPFARPSDELGRQAIDGETEGLKLEAAAPREPEADGLHDFSIP